jgi:hypothetical protein
MPNGPKVPPSPAKKWLPAGTAATPTGYVPAAALPAPSQPLGPGQRTQRLLNQQPQIPQQQAQRPPPNQAHLEQIRKVGTDRIKRIRYAQGNPALDEIRLICLEVVLRYPIGRLAVPPLKGMARATENVANKFMGDWWSIRDLARLTIILPDAAQCEQAAKEIVDVYQRHAMARAPKPGEWESPQERAHVHLPKRVIEYKVVRPAADAGSGYSGWAVFVRTENGSPAEIQLNTPRMIYAKEKEQDARSILGDATFNSVHAQYRLPAGLGHALYETTRATGVNPAQKAACEAVSRKYYDYFRSPTPNGGVRQWLEAEIARLGLDHH